MRIISGKFKGRVLKVPNPKYTRPTTDRTKETIFNYLNNLIDFNDILVCDIYGGSGSLGLEALSRGAGEIHFVEKNYSVSKVLTQNIELVKAEENTKLYKMSALKFSNLESHLKYDLIFADPPFFKDDIHIVVKNILENDFLTKNSIFIIERSIQTKEKDIINFNIQPFKRIGDSLIYEFRNF